MILYTDFIAEYPPYGVAPYTQSIVEAYLKEVSLLYPSIEGCLPLDTQILATYYGLKILELEADCDATAIANASSYTSLNDKIVYVRAKNPGALVNSLFGQKLNRLFRIHGCFFAVAKRTVPLGCRGCESFYRTTICNCCP